MVLVVKDKNKKRTKHHKLQQGKFLLNLVEKPQNFTTGNSSTGTGCPEMLWIFCSLNYLKLAWIDPEQPSLALFGAGYSD